MQIHINRDGQRFGPYSLEEAREYLAMGNLVKTDLAWLEGSLTWVPLGQIEGIDKPATASSPLPAWVPPRRDTTPAPTSAIPWGVPSKKPANEPAHPTTGPNDPSMENTPQQQPRINPFVQQQRAVAARNMLIGGAIFGIGVGITFLSYSAAESSPHGGTYVFAWGAILFGALRFVTGLSKYFKA